MKDEERSRNRVYRRGRGDLRQEAIKRNPRTEFQKLARQGRQTLEVWKSETDDWPTNLESELQKESLLKDGGV